jgi:hypothetical protein
VNTGNLVTMQTSGLQLTAEPLKTNGTKHTIDNNSDIAKTRLPLCFDAYKKKNREQKIDYQ